MALIVGTDSYVTLAECEAYLADHYVSSDLSVWDGLTDQDKTVILRHAAQTIDRLPLKGYKAFTEQTMAFPRMLFADFRQRFAGGSISRDANWIIQTEVPQAVKDAQCEMAITGASGTPERVSMAREGVRSYRLGNLSETLTGEASKTVASYEARQLLAPYVGGGYAIL